MLPRAGQSEKVFSGTETDRPQAEILRLALDNINNGCLCDKCQGL